MNTYTVDRQTRTPHTTDTKGSCDFPLSDLCGHETFSDVRKKWNEI